MNARITSACEARDPTVERVAGREDSLEMLESALPPLVPWFPLPHIHMHHTPSTAHCLYILSPRLLANYNKDCKQAEGGPKEAESFICAKPSLLHIVLYFVPSRSPAQPTMGDFKNKTETEQTSDYL